MSNYQDKIRGCLFGGAVGDALGYPVEFLSYSRIRQKYGPQGIQRYALDPETGLALISDDTQMSLFTANGILFGDTRGHTRGIAANPSDYVRNTYLDWLTTQTGKKSEMPISWLLNIPELHARRAPGTTCLHALSSGEMGSIKRHCNDSKGCGGIMRAAPMGLRPGDPEAWDLEGAECAAITHGHPLGYMPAAVLTHLVHVGVFGDCGRGDTLADALDEALDVAAKLFAGEPYLGIMQKLVRRAVELSRNTADDEENIRCLGEGWVAEETLAIAVYCSLRYADDFTKGVIAAVNHTGDSDSTGAVTGNILGAWLGYDRIEPQWKENLELSSVILEIADDLGTECPISEYHFDERAVWSRKYVFGTYPAEWQADRE